VTFWLIFFDISIQIKLTLNNKQAVLLELPTLRTQLKQEMAPYKIPTILKLVDGIERNAMGKVNKKDLLKKYWPDA
jgi:non-ribosomal peptide synthetase component E (peptide arylation enzyme)